MRIVDRAAFLTLPAGTIFAKYGNAAGDPDHQYFGDVAIKDDTVAGVDFVVQALTGQFEGWTGSESDSDEHERMAADPQHESPVLDYDSAGRDGLFDEGQLFAVWSKADAVALVARLRQALRDGYGVEEG